MNFHRILSGIIFMLISYQATSQVETLNGILENEVVELSQDKWEWMANREMEKLKDLFHEKAQFVHMGGTMSQEQELEVIQSGRIHYKKADILEVSVKMLDNNTAILLNRITLLAVVGGNEVTNPFVVTEIYQKEEGNWKLANMSFVRQLSRSEE